MKTNLSQSEQFKILWKFFVNHGAEIGARSSDELLPDQKVALTLMASGKIGSDERSKLIPLLRSNRRALTFLSEQIKIFRPGAARTRPSTRSRVAKHKKP
jgi:hypothetical protein